MNHKVIRYTLGWVLNLEAVAMALPLICALIYREKTMALIFLATAALCVLIGTLLMLQKKNDQAMYAKEGYIIVALSWILISIFGAIPFVVSGAIPNVIQALFETVSGFSTTGASVLGNVEILPKSLLFWRSFTHWMGGMGVLVFLVAVLPLFGGSNLYLIKAESPGPSVSKLVPKVRSTAKILYAIYIVLTLVEVVFLLCGNMNLFDALTTSFGTAGTGGFGIRNSSIADFSPYIQNVITVFMLLFGVDFSLYYLLLIRNFRDVLKSDELRAYLIIVAAATAIISFNCRPLFSSFSESLRHSAFQVASVITTTGYSTADFNLWPSLSKTIMVMLMFIGACAGSTGGGIKVSRILILFKSIVKEIKITAHPKTTLKITMNGHPIEHETLRAVNVYMASYAAIFAISLLIISIDGFDFTTNFTAVLAAINNIGPGLEMVGPTQNFSIFSPLSTFILTLDMLIGRLEIFPMLVLFAPHTWKK